MSNISTDYAAWKNSKAGSQWWCRLSDGRLAINLENSKVRMKPKNGGYITSNKKKFYLEGK